MEKDLFTERRATVCYSNYREMGCKSFFHPLGLSQKGTGLFLLASDGPRRCGLAAAILVREKSRVLFRKREKEEKFWPLISITHWR